MGFAVSLSKDDVAFAEELNILRREHTTNHKPAAVRDGDLVGCTAEVAWCKHHRIPYAALGYDHGGTGDGGIDITLPDGTTIDIKCSADHPDSWLVKRLKAHWYVFAYVEMPYQVHFLGKQNQPFLRELPLFTPVPGTRRVRLHQLLPIAADDFAFLAAQAA